MFEPTGTYAPARSFHSLVAALADWDPNAVLMAASAAPRDAFAGSSSGR